MKIGTFPQLEKALLLFFEQQSTLGKPISGSVPLEKTEILQEKLLTDGETEGNELMLVETECDNVTVGFVNRFKQRNGIRKLKYVGEKASAQIKAQLSHSTTISGIDGTREVNQGANIQCRRDWTMLAFHS